MRFRASHGCHFDVIVAVVAELPFYARETASLTSFWPAFGLEFLRIPFTGLLVRLPGDPPDPGLLELLTSGTLLLLLLLEPDTRSLVMFEVLGAPPRCSADPVAEVVGAMAVGDAPTLEPILDRIDLFGANESFDGSFLDRLLALPNDTSVCTVLAAPRMRLNSEAFLDRARFGRWDVGGFGRLEGAGFGRMGRLGLSREAAASTRIRSPTQPSLTNCHG